MDMIGRRSVRGLTLAAVAAVIAVVTAACGGSSVTPAVTYITPAPATPGPGATPTPAPPPPEITSVLISSNAPDSRWTAIFKKPVIGSVGTAQKMNDTITAQVNGYIATFTSGGLPPAVSGAGPSTLDGNFTIALDTSDVVSLHFTILTYVSGNAHPQGLAGSVNLDVATGSKINLSDVFTNSATALPVVAAKAKAALTTSLADDLQWPSGTIAMPFFDKAWTVTPDGLEFTWSQGEIASQAAGTPSATVSWADLKPLINPKGPLAGFVR